MRRLSRLAAAGALLVAAGLGCGVDLSGWFSADAPPDFARPVDMRITFPPIDIAVEPGPDLPRSPEPCEEGDPRCLRERYGPPNRQFPLRSDDPRDPLESDVGVIRDVDGALRIDNAYKTLYNAAYITNTQDPNGGGTVSKIDTKMVREVARYLSVTCSSLKTGSTAPCDGQNGCCALDDQDRYAARAAKTPEPGHQAVQRMANQPSRTSVDYNLDLFVVNRAPGGQASVTRIAADLNDCVDRNQNKTIDTSSDVDGNGWIDVDCNGDGVPDDIAGVQKKPCSNGMAQEFYGLDDECVLWTTNVFAPGARATTLSLASDNNSFSHPWVASPTGKVVRIDGLTAQIKADTALPADCTMGSGPWGSAMDYNGVAWVTEKDAGKLCWFDTKKAPYASGVVRDPQWGTMVGSGIAMDRDQNVWVGGGVARYRPDRSNGLNNLSAGWWMRIDGATGSGIAADSRNAKDYFVFSCQGSGVLEIPASQLAVMKADQTVMNPGWPVIKMPCTGVALDRDQNVWGIDGQSSTRALVDKNGVITQPNVNGQPMGKNKCPAGDSCPNLGAEVYSDFTTVGYRYYGPYQGRYAMVVRGCIDDIGNPADTQWWSITWDADVPPNTQLYVHAKASDSSAYSDPEWGFAQWTPDFPASPADLIHNLAPNQDPNDPWASVHDAFLLVEFLFKTSVSNGSPRLRWFSVNYRCPNRTLP